MKLFEHHLPAWACAEAVADALLSFVVALVVVQLMATTPLGAAGASPLVAGGAVPLLQAASGAALFALAMLLLFSFVGLYRRSACQARIRALFGRTLLALAAGLPFAGLVTASTHGDLQALVPFACVLPLLAVGVIGVHRAGQMARRSPLGMRRVLIVGAGDEARRVAEEINSPSGGGEVVGFSMTGPESDWQDWSGRSAPVYPRGVPLTRLVDRCRVSDVIVAVDERRAGGVPMDQLLACRMRGVPVLDLADFWERTRGEVPLGSLKASWIVYGHGFEQSAWRAGVKRVFDVVVSLLLLLLLMPVMLLAVIAVRLDSPGPVLYRQERVGQGGRSFMCLKLRSMRVDAESDGVARWASAADDRVTRVGAFLRKTRIDELPQLFSVLCGQMSLVGPRPERPQFVQMLRAQVPFYDLRHSVKPGVTGWAQVHYSYGSSVEDARRKHEFDLYYLKNQSLFLDLLVLVETVSVVLFHDGAR